MKTLTTLLILAASLYAADAPKATDLPAVPVEKQLELRTAQLHVARLSDALGKLAMQYTALEKQQKDAQEALEKLVKSIPKPKDCADCELSDALVWTKPKTELAKETKQ